MAGGEEEKEKVEDEEEKDKEQSWVMICYLLSNYLLISPSKINYSLCLLPNKVAIKSYRQ